MVSSFHFLSLGQFLRGFENWMMDFGDNEGFVDALLERTTRLQMECNEMLLREVGDLVDIVCCSDDVAHQGGPLCHPDTYRQLYGGFAGQNPLWNEIPSGGGEVYDWDPESTYIQEPPYFEGFGMQPGGVADVRGTRALAVFGDSVTTDHTSPAGSIKPTSPAGKYLISRGVAIEDFNSYGARRGNHQVMVRGTFANVRIKNLLVPGVEGGVTRLPCAPTMGKTPRVNRPASGRPRG